MNHMQTQMQEKIRNYTADYGFTLIFQDTGPNNGYALFTKSYPDLIRVKTLEYFGGSWEGKSVDVPLAAVGPLIDVLMPASAGQQIEYVDLGVG
jgi:hypothetical protein